MTQQSIPGCMTHTQAADYIANAILEVAFGVAADVMPRDTHEMRSTVVAAAIGRARQRNEATIENAAKVRQGLPCDFHDDLGAR